MPVPREHRLRLAPLDSLLIRDADGFTYRISDWSGDVPVIPLFVGDQYRPVMPRHIERDGDDLLLVLDDEVHASESVFWAGRACALSPAGPKWPTQFVARGPGGVIARILRYDASSARMALIVAGIEPVELEDARGQVLSHRVADPGEGAQALRVDGTTIAWGGERIMTVATLPKHEFLLADNGVRWRWTDEDERGRRRGVWVQLLPPDDLDSEATVDARAAYCDEGVRDVRTQKGGDQAHSYRVMSVRRDDYRMELDRLPPEGSTLFIPSSTSGLRRQRQVVFRLKDSPLPHHRSLLTLCEAPEKVHWQRCARAPVTHWYLLDDERFSGTLQQREFVSKALGTPDFAFLEGPPGSGKTHAICELVLQFIDRGLDVLLCSTTHVAVDNVLERLAGRFEQVEALRIGFADRVDPILRDVQIDARIATLAKTWRTRGIFADLDDGALERVAESTVLASVNLTCGTSTGILAHPYIRRSGDGSDQDSGPRRPYFDVLIIDEASKTTFQEFLVPAQLARRWIIVGDVRQLPPFSEAKDLEASIAEVSNANAKAGATAVLSQAHQAALLIAFRLRRPEAGQQRAGGQQARWLIEEPAEVLDALLAEIAARGQRDEVVPEVVRVVEGRSLDRCLSITEIEAGGPAALRLLTGDWILFPPALRARLEPYLPPDGLALRDWAPDSLRAFRFARWHAREGTFKRPIHEQRRRFATADALAARQREFLSEESWAKQVAWRLSRVHQLGSASDPHQRERRQEEVDALMPAVKGTEWVPLAIDAIRDIGVRSVIEAFRVRREDPHARRRSALTDAIPAPIWEQRAVLLEYQHRMHPDISRLPRELFYAGEALKDATTLDGRDEHKGWTFLPAAPSRRLWVDVRGHEDRGVNAMEIDAMRRWLEAFRDYAASHPPRSGRRWEIACLSFYNRQELGVRDMLRQLTSKKAGETRFELPNTTIVCATVDRFQGREADLVLLSLRNTSRPGHMDSPNRLNVGITRARFLLAIFGHHGYFAHRCPSHELHELVKDTPVFDLRGKP